MPRKKTRTPKKVIQEKCKFTDIHIDERELSTTRISTLFELTMSGNHVIKKVNIHEEEQEMKFQLKEISKTELLLLRYQMFPLFVLKKGNKLFYSKIPQTFFTPTDFKLHLCSHVGRDCHFLSSSNEGGCPKVIDPIVKFYKIHDPSFSEFGSEFMEDIYRSKRIEKYDWITYGVQTYCTDLDIFWVFECKNHRA